MIRDLAIGFVAGLLVAGGICAWKAMKPSLPSVLAPPSKELAKAPTRTLEGRKVVVYDKKIEKKLGLPDIVTKDPDKHVVASSPVPASDYPQTMMAVYDEKVGNVDMFLRRDPLPWFDFNRRYEIGYSWLPLTDGGGEAMHRVDGRAELLQLKALRFGVVGEISEQAGEFHWQAGGRVWYVFH